MGTDYTVEELAKAFEELAQEMLEAFEEMAAYGKMVEEGWKGYKDEDIIRERSYERQNKRSNRILNAESKRKSRVAFHAAPGTCQYIRGRDGGGRYR